MEDRICHGGHGAIGQQTRRDNEYFVWGLVSSPQGRQRSGELDVENFSRQLGLSAIFNAVVGTKMVRVTFQFDRGHGNTGLLRTPAQSIMGATLKRRDGSGRVVCGLQAVSRDILVYACLYHLPGFQAFLV